MDWAKMILYLLKYGFLFLAIWYTVWDGIYLIVKLLASLNNTVRFTDKRTNYLKPSLFWTLYFLLSNFI